MPTTLTAPISTEQINNTVYVGQGDVTTIQKAVTFAVAQGGEWRVAIPAGYTGNDSPLTVTGGSAAVWIVDERNGMERPFIWFNGAYIYAALNQRGGIATPELNNMLFVGKTVDKFPTIQSAIDFSTSVPSIDFLIIVTNNYDGTENIADLVNGSGTMQVIDQRDTTQQWAYWYWDGTKFTPAGIILEGDMTVNGNVTVETLTALGNSAFNGTVTVSDDLAVFGDCGVNGTLHANAALVANSPVRTFANTPDAPGPSYPPAGIGVSTGTSWDPASIDPATLRTFDNTPDQAFPAAGIGVSTGTAWGASIDPATLATWPSAGIAVSTGSAWGVPIAPTDVPRISAGTNTFTGNMVVDGTILGGSIWSYKQSSAIAPAWPAIGIRVNDANGSAYVSAPSQGLLLNYDSGIDGVYFCNGAGTATAHVDSSGNAQFNGSAKVAGGVTITGNGSTIPLQVNQLRLSTDGANGNVYFDSIGPNTTTLGQFLFRGAHSDGSALGTWLTISSPASGPTIAAGVSNLVLDAATSGGIFFNYHSGTGGVHFSNGAGQEVANVDSSGNAHFNGTLSAGNKQFKIPHPSEPDKWLTHGSLEGPENGVFYRGEAVTDGRGMATITLPDYFEVLTRKVNRSVLLTHQDDNLESEIFVMLKAGAVKDGRFGVRSSEPNTKFMWMVMADRADIPPLEAVTNIPEGTPREDGMFGVKIPPRQEEIAEAPPAKEPKGKNKKQ
jgi:hypothetical protein